mgnify:CR=1 FL=1
MFLLSRDAKNFLDSELLTEKTTANFPETEKGCPRDGDDHIRPICCLKVLKPLPSITLPSWQVTTVWEATSPTPTTVPQLSLCTVAI